MDSRADVAGTNGRVRRDVGFPDAIAERRVFRLLFAGGMAKRLYRLYARASV